MTNNNIYSSNLPIGYYPSKDYKGTLNGNYIKAKTTLVNTSFGSFIKCLN